MAGLLFLAFAYLAVGQAAVNRNGAQTAADAAALAAAQKTRDQLAGKWVAAVLDPTKWQDIFAGRGADDFCWRADQLAGQNHAHVQRCSLDVMSYTVAVESDRTVGKSVIPGTEDKRSSASARAVIEPLCTFTLPDAGGADHSLPQLACKDGDWKLDSDDLTDLPKPENLFDVHLAG